MTNTHIHKTFAAILFYSLFMISCNNKSNPTNDKIQQNKNSTVKIGAQIWATQNLDVTTFRNGDYIPEAKTNEEWRKAEKEKKTSMVLL